MNFKVWKTLEESRKASNSIGKIESNDTPLLSVDSLILNLSCEEEYSFELDSTNTFSVLFSVLLLPIRQKVGDIEAVLNNGIAEIKHFNVSTDINFDYCLSSFIQYLSSEYNTQEVLLSNSVYPLMTQHLYNW